MPVAFQREAGRFRNRNVPNQLRDISERFRNGTAINDLQRSPIWHVRCSTNGMEDVREELDVAKGNAHLLSDLVKGRVLYVVAGMAWVTQEGDSRDYVLGPGGMFRVQKPGRVVVQALRRSRVLVTSLGDIEHVEAVKSGMTNEEVA